MARSPKISKTKSKKQTYTVMLELLTPVQCEFEIEATSPTDAIDKAMELDWDYYAPVGAVGDGPIYCAELSDENGDQVRIPDQYTQKTVMKEEGN